MGTITRGYSWGATEQVTAAKLHTLVDSATISAILTADISDAQITNAKVNDVSGAKLTTLTAIPAGAGVIPAANLTSVAQKGANSDITSLAGLTTVLSRAQGGLASSVANNAASGVVFLDGSSKLPAVDGSQLTNLSATLVGISGQVFTSSGTWTCPAGITKVYVKLIGGGGEGGNTSHDGSAGGASTFVGTTTLTGGGGAAGNRTSNGGAGGTGSGGYLHATGEVGVLGNAVPAKNPAMNKIFTETYGNGGKGDGPNVYGGGAGGYAEGVIAVTGNVTVTVGAGGAGSGYCEDGISGVVIVMW